MSGSDVVPAVLAMRLAGADPSVPLPSYESAGAAGADLRANLPEALREAGLLLEPGARVLVPTGLALQLPDGVEAQIRPRSGLALRHGVTVMNAPGTVDSDYRGEIGVALVNLGQEPFVIAHGARIAQMVLAPVLRLRFEPAEALGHTVRGAGGFGSTGGLA